MQVRYTRYWKNIYCTKTSYFSYLQRAQTEEVLCDAAAGVEPGDAAHGGALLHVGQRGDGHPRHGGRPRTQQEELHLRVCGQTSGQGHHLERLQSGTPYTRLTLSK